MATYRTVNMSFWNDDTKVKDDFTPEDKYFYLYLITNPHTNLAGCYEISLKTMSDETGYSKDTIERLLDRFENVHEVIKFSNKTKEIYILNWSKYNWTTSDKFRKPLLTQILAIKNDDFRNELIGFYDNPNTLSIPYQYPIDTSVTVINNNKDSYIDNIKNIIDYFNYIIGTHYSYKNESNNKHIRARLDEGFTVDDFKVVIDKKFKQWGNDSNMSQYLRPSTLFSKSHFEEYLNQQDVADKGSVEATYDVVNEWLRGSSDE